MKPGMTVTLHTERVIHHAGQAIPTGSAVQVMAAKKQLYTHE